MATDMTSQTQPPISTGVAYACASGDLLIQNLKKCLGEGIDDLLNAFTYSTLCCIVQGLKISPFLLDSLIHVGETTQEGPITAPHNFEPF